MRGRIVAGLVLLALVAVVAAGPFGLLGSSAAPAPSVSPRPSGTAVVPASSSAIASPDAEASEPTASEPAPAPQAPGPVAIADVPIVPVTQFRATQTSTSADEVVAVLNGTSDRYVALELVKGEADE